MTLKQYLKIKRREIDQGLKSCLPKVEKEVPSLWKSMNYSLFSKGKRIRPVLMYAVYDSLHHPQSPSADGRISARWNPTKKEEKFKKVVCATACAIEIVHTSSLILDDFPCMDNAAIRHEKPTNHIVFGEAIAMLAADALLTYAFELLAREVPGELGIELIRHLAQTVGTKGMIGGQTMDIQSRGKVIDYETLMYIHQHKTAALFEYAARAGALLAQANPTEVDTIVRYAADLGLAYQITDDILDTIETGEVPSTVHPEVNFVSIMGKDNAKRKLDELIQCTKQHLSRLNFRGDILPQIADYVESRIQRKSKSLSQGTSIS